MAIYAIGDLHLSFSCEKPMNIFGNSWLNHEDKIKKNWIEKVKEEDTVVLNGDFSWAMYLEEAKKDFAYLNALPGKKILLKGNHDYWWSTLKKIKEFLKKNQFEKIELLQNNSFEIEGKIIAGVRGWNTIINEENMKYLKRDNQRLKISIEDGITRFGKEKEIIVFMHYPPFYKNPPLYLKEEIDFIQTMKQYGVQRCYYAHLHGNAHNDAQEGVYEGIEFRLISCDYTNFDLVKI